jgi:GTP-binding protein
VQVVSATFVVGAASPAQLPPCRFPEVAFAGRSNVGKSSLLNRLLGRRKLARVSKTPGRTQQVNFFTVNERLMFVDLPGYGFARVPLEVKKKWSFLVASYLESRPCLRAVVLIVDMRRGIEPDDQMLMDYLEQRGIPVILALTKIDKVSRVLRHSRLREVSRQPAGARPIPFSALTGEGREELWQAILSVVGRPGDWPVPDS